MKTIEMLKQENEVPVIIASAQGEISYVNNSFEKVFGWNSSEIVGKHLTTIIPKNLHDAHNMGFSRFLTTESPTLLNQPLNLQAVKKDGEVFDSEHIIYAEKQEGKWVFGATIRPLSQ